MVINRHWLLLLLSLLLLLLIIKLLVYSIGYNIVIIGIFVSFSCALAILVIVNIIIGISKVVVIFNDQVLPLIAYI